jgi:hypothetical protein
VGCGYPITAADLRLRCGSVLVDQAAEDLIAPQPSLVTIITAIAVAVVNTTQIAPK